MEFGIEAYEIKFELKGNDETRFFVVEILTYTNLIISLAESITVITKRQALLMSPLSCFGCWPHQFNTTKLHTNSQSRLIAKVSLFFL